MVVLLQANLISLIPVIGPPFTFLHLSLLYSLYAFEYTWMNFGKFNCTCFCYVSKSLLENYVYFLLHLNATFVISKSFTFKKI